MAPVSVSNSISLLPLPLSIIFSVTLLCLCLFPLSECCCISVLICFLQKQLVSFIQLRNCTYYKLSMRLDCKY